MTEKEEPYMGTVESDGSIKVEGPMTAEDRVQKMKDTDKPVIGVSADSTGNAILKIITTAINSERSKGK